MHACTWMPQEMLRMCNKGLFAGIGLSGLKLHCFYDILRLYSYGGTILPLPQCLMFKQALKSGYNACLKYATISLLIIFQKILPLGQIWTDLSGGGGGFLLVIGQGELAKSAGSESNSCEQLLSPNYIRAFFKNSSVGGPTTKRDHTIPSVGK